ncbi:hypothetical protein [Mesorhizobium sp. WSM3860]|uniref:hypothetical protein n=1 Tax=Mesorhizobium sp. WSM3860 TaxID=2029403 RepID=UPI000BAFB6A9|nr:hypothetical protein [Mesorhizobium sp. WSM3860]PBC00644.1 hypothetical protein CK220_30065 [Mesorhizobium sp. WSM3860]
MKYLMFTCSTSSVLLLSWNPAFAFNFGFVRVPDWMDPYIGVLVVLTFFFWLGLAATKPSGVPFQQVRYVKISPIANFFYLGLAFFFTIMMVMLFAGMGLRRYAEWTGAA